MGPDNLTESVVQDKNNWCLYYNYTLCLAVNVGINLKSLEG